MSLQNKLKFRRVKNETDAVKQAVIGMDLQYGDAKVIDKGDGVRLIVSKSEKRAKKDAVVVFRQGLVASNNLTTHK